MYFNLLYPVTQYTVIGIYGIKIRYVNIRRVTSGWTKARDSRASAPSITMDDDLYGDITGVTAAVSSAAGSDGMDGVGDENIEINLVPPCVKEDDLSKISLLAPNTFGEHRPL